MKFLNWMPEKDIFLKKQEAHIHHLLHEKMSEISQTREDLLRGRRRWRKGIIDCFPLIVGEIKGKVLDIGAGDGWAGAYIANKYDNVNIYSLECNMPAVQKLIPKTFKTFGVEDYFAVYGTFNNILENDFDFIISMGAIHHSSNLFHTLKECYNALKIGGWLLASEPCIPNNITNKELYDGKQKIKDFWGVSKIKEEDRSDNHYRLCEYETAAYHAGFDVYPFIFDDKATDGNNHILKNKTCYRDFEKVLVSPYISETAPDRLFLALHKKTELNYIPHSWEK